MMMAERTVEVKTDDVSGRDYYDGLDGERVYLTPEDEARVVTQAPPQAPEAESSGFDPPGDWSNVEPLEAAKRFGTGFAIGAPATYAGGAILGGPVGPGIAAVGGVASGIGSVGEYLAEQGVFGETMQSGPGSFGAGLVADIGSDIAMRKGIPLATGRTLGREIPGLIRKFSNSRRAIKELEDANLASTDIGTRGAERVREIVVEGAGVLKAKADAAWDAWRVGVSGEAIPVKKLKEALGPIAEQGEFAPDGTIKRIIYMGDQEVFTAERLQNLRSELSDNASAAFRAGNDKAGARLSRAVEALDEFAESFGDQEAHAALVLARAASREFFSVAEKKGPKGLLNKHVIKPDIEDMANPTKAMHKIFSGELSLASVKQMRKAAQEAGRLPEFEREFKLSVLQYLQGTLAGATGTGGAAMSAPAMLRKVQQNENLVTAALGPKGRTFLVDTLLEPLTRHTRPDRAAKLPVRVSGQDRVVPALAGALGFTGGMTPEAAIGGALALYGGGKAYGSANRAFGALARKSMQLDYMTDPAVRASMDAASRSPLIGGTFKLPASIALGRRTLSSGLSGGLSNYERTRQR